MSESMATAPEGEIADEVVQPIAADEEQPRSPEELSGEPDGPEAEEPPEPELDPAPEAPPEEVEFDLGGTKLKVPKGAIPEDVAAKLHDWSKAAQRGHTQRSQDVAELRKAVEAEYSAAQSLRKTSAEVQNLFGQGLSVKQHIEQLEAASADPNLWQNDPNGARQVSDTLSRKRLELQRIAEAVAAGETALEHAERTKSEASARQDRERAERMATEGREIVQKAITGFDSKAEADLIAYAVKSGVAEEHARSWALNPMTAIFAHKAMMWDRAQAAGTPLRPKPTAPVAPIKGVQSSAGGSPTDPEHMDMDQFASWLKARRR